MNTELEELLSKINTETVITEQWDDPHYLSNLLLRLASYYASLSRPIAEAESREAQAGLDASVSKEQAKRRHMTGKSAALSESLARIESKPAFEVQIKEKEEVRLLFLTRQNLDKAMDAIRSKLSYLKTERESQ